MKHVYEWGLVLAIAACASTPRLDVPVVVEPSRAASASRDIVAGGVAPAGARQDARRSLADAAYTAEPWLLAAR